MVPQGPTPGNGPLPHSIAIAAGPAHGSAVTSLAAPLQDLLLRPVAEWPAAGFERIKERTVRSVLRGELGTTAVHLKVFRAHRLADRARDALRGPRGAREAAHLHAARALGLPAVEPLAFGMASDEGGLRSFLATRTVDGAEPFAWPAAAPVQRAAGALLRALHDRGLLVPDLHPGNLLVDGQGQPWLCDLTDLRHRGDVALAERAAALAFFCQPLDGGALDPSARDLLAGYLAAGALPEPALHRELALATHRWRAAALPAFGRRAMRDCRHTQLGEQRRGQPRWFWHRDTTTAARRDAVIQFAAAPPLPLRTGRRGSVWLLPDLAVKERDGGRAQHLWRAAYWLQFAGVPIAAPVALRRWLGRGHVFSVRLPGPDLAQELAAGRLDAAALQRTAAELGRCIGRLHAHGLRNRDLKLENLVRDPATGVVRMVDLEGVRRKSADDARGAGSDLGRLLAAHVAAGEPGGAAVRRTFLRGYLRAHRQLLQHPPLRRIVRRAGERAGEWAAAHRA